MQIKAQFPSKCAKCGGSIRAGEQINYENKKGYHLSCGPSDEEPSTQDVDRLRKICIDLGFRSFEDIERDGIPDAWRTMSVLRGAPGDDAGRKASPSLFD